MLSQSLQTDLLPAELQILFVNHRSDKIKIPVIDLQSFFPILLHLLLVRKLDLLVRHILVERLKIGDIIILIRIRKIESDLPLFTIIACEKLQDIRPHVIQP